MPGASTRHLAEYVAQPAAGVTHPVTAADTGTTVSDSIARAVVAQRPLGDTGATISEGTVAANDSFTRTITVGSGWGTADSGQAWTTYNTTTTPNAANYGVNGSAGSMALNGVGADRSALLPAAHTDIEVVARFQHTETPVGDNVNYRLMARASDNQNGYIATVNVSPANGGIVNLYPRVAGTQGAGLASDVSIGTLTVAAWYWIRFRLVGTTLQVKVWADGSAEPSSWTNTATDSTFSSGSFIGVSGRANASNTNLPTVFFDDFSATSLTNPVVTVTHGSATTSRAVSDTGSTVTESLNRTVVRGPPTPSDTGASVSDSVAVIRVRKATLADTGTSSSPDAGITTKRTHALADTGASITDSQRRSVGRVLSDQGASVSDALVQIQTARPVADDSVGAWTVPPLWAKVDEATPDTADYIESPASPASPAAARMQLDALSPPTSSGYRRIRYMLGKDQPGGDTVTATVRVYQGATLIAEWSQATPDSWTLVEQTLTPAQEAAITDYSSLHVEVEAVKA